MAGHVESSGWRPFAAGCRAVQVGLLIELMAVLWVLTSLMYMPVRRLFFGLPFSRPAVVDAYGLQLLLPVGLLVFVGAVATTFGRWRMSDLPVGAGARGVLTVTAALATTRAVVLATSVVLLTMAGRGWGEAAVVVEAAAATAYGCGLLAGTAAELSALPGVALIAGAIPSRRLRVAAGRAAVAILLLGTVWLAVLAAGVNLYFADRPIPRLVPGWQSVIQLAALTLGLVSITAYTWVQYRLHSVACSAVCTDPDPTN